MKARWFAAAALMGLSVHTTALAKVSAARVERSPANALALNWESPDPVDVYESDRPTASAEDARLLARGVTGGSYTLADAGLSRRYFILVDRKDGDTVKAAERAVPLPHGSNFRDLGGYAGAGGKHVRWGLIFRSGGQPMLTDEDMAQIKAIGVAQVVDLRSDEERVIAPTGIDGVPYSAIGYSMVDLLGGTSPDKMRNGVAIYHGFPLMLVPQLKLVFADLLRRQAPLVYNCSAGQDRTGFTTAMILSALGVPRETIYADYQLSTRYRRPQFEMPKLDPAAYPGNPVAKMFARFQADPRYQTPTPLVEADGTPFLKGAFDEIDAKWGSVEQYLEKEVGLTEADFQALRRLYLE